MKIVDYIELLRRNIKTLRNILIAYLIVLILYDVLLHFVEHGHYLIDNIPAFWTIFGIVGCFLLIKIAKGIAHIILSKDVDYYG